MLAHSCAGHGLLSLCVGRTSLLFEKKGGMEGEGERQYQTWLHHCLYGCALQVGYSLNALVDFPPDDPIAIIKHLMVGSEGTLGFISNVTYNTVPEVHHKVRCTAAPCAAAMQCCLLMGPKGAADSSCAFACSAPGPVAPLPVCDCVLHPTVLPLLVGSSPQSNNCVVALSAGVYPFCILLFWRLCEECVTMVTHVGAQVPRKAWQRAPHTVCCLLCVCVYAACRRLRLCCSRTCRVRATL